MSKPNGLQEYRLLESWLITQRGKSLLISGGADANYEIELETETASFFADLKAGKAFNRSQLDSSDLPILEELVTAEIVAPILQQSKLLSIAVLGDGNTIGRLESSTIKLSQGKAYDLGIVIRAKDTYTDFLQRINYQDITRPHLFIDMAFHHTVSIGPLVFPRETACVACLQGRITRRWGDNQPPALPKAASQYQSLVTEMTKLEIGRLAEGDTSLTNKTVSYNLLDRTARKDQLLKVPLCPICSQNKIDRDGSLALPWVKDESPSNSV